jgi:hypothetical protein
MVRHLLVLTAAVLILAGCARQAPVPPPVKNLGRAVSYLEDVKPVFDSRCAVCHSCYNAACQLKLSSFEGTDRGGSKTAVYASRLRDQPPTRLFMDARTTQQWRGMGFHSVTANHDSNADSIAEQHAGNDSIMAYFLDAKRRSPVPEGEYRAEDSNLSCPASTRQVRSFLGKHPARGMPFGMPVLSRGEHDLLTTWLEQGAMGPSAAEQAALTSPDAANAAQVLKWEAFLNADDPKHALTARYLYEHFFLAHVRFAETHSNEFFRLVRSRTPTGQPIAPIATVRPYDNPGIERFYYRFEKIHSTIVFKTHIVVEFSDRTLARYHELFIDSEWLEPPHRMAFDDESGANPFLIYAQIPPRVRYQFLLDHSEYMIRTFIRGPVCKGQIALNVIHDHFWVLFLDPEADQTIQRPQFLVEQADNLRLPTERGSDMRLISIFSNRYRDRYARFYAAKNALYDETVPDGLGMDAIWPGNRPSDAPLLTIYRHFDSASVRKGALGDLPRTLWVIDYSQFERIYYALVAGFDVFGTVSHQANVRRYMDYLRMEGELNFLTFLPPKDRVAIFQSWYVGAGAMEQTKHQEVLTSRATQVVFATQDPKREFVERAVTERLLDTTGIGFDPVNYHGAGEQYTMPTTFATRADILQGFRALTAPGTGFIRHVTSTEANVLFVRVRRGQGTDHFFSIVINRWHDNVSSMFGEKKRLDPAKDTIDFLSSSIGAYPNYFLEVDLGELPDFFDMLQNFDGSPAYVTKLNGYGVNRMDERFWDVYDWFQQRLNAQQPIHAGLYDLNRYYSRAFTD